MSFPNQSKDDRDDPYIVLGISRDASADQIKSAYRKLALKFHPDKQLAQDKEKCNEIFAKIASAYEILSDDRRRDNFDRYGHMEGMSSEYYQPQHRPFSGIFSGFRGQFPNDDIFYHTDPFEVFRRVFSEEFHPKTYMNRSKYDEVFFRDPFFGRQSNDDLFSSVFNRHQDIMNMMNDGFRGQTQFYSSTSSGRGNVFSESVSTTTKIINGKRQTITERKITHPDGTTERHVEKSGDDDFPLLSDMDSRNISGYLASSNERGNRK